MKFHKMLCQTESEPGPSVPAAHPFAGLMKVTENPIQVRLPDSNSRVPDLEFDPFSFTAYPYADLPLFRKFNGIAQ